VEILASEEEVCVMSQKINRLKIAIELVVDDVVDKVDN
jgi:hypothetical protein